MSEPNGQLDAIIAAIRALDTKVENYSINLRNEFVNLREIFASHREYVDRRFETQVAQLAHITEIAESFQMLPIGIANVLERKAEDREEAI